MATQKRKPPHANLSSLADKITPGVRKKRIYFPNTSCAAFPEVWSFFSSAIQVIAAYIGKVFCTWRNVALYPPSTKSSPTSSMGVFGICILATHRSNRSRLNSSFYLAHVMPPRHGGVSSESKYLESCLRVGNGGFGNPHMLVSKSPPNPHHSPRKNPENRRIQVTVCTF